MSTQLSTPTDRQSAEALSRSKNEPNWLVDLRGEAAELAGTLEWPKPEKVKIERWNLTAVGSYDQAAPANALTDLPEVVRELVAEGTENLVIQQNSSPVWTQLSAELAAKGVIFTDLETACKEHGDLVKPYLFQAVAKDEDKLTALHAALWNGGVFVYVPRNVEVEIPLQAILFNTKAEASFAPHIVIVAESNSRVTYVDYVVTEPGAVTEPFVYHSVVEVYVKAGAHVRFGSIHHLGGSGVDLTVRRAIIDNDGVMEWVLGDLSDGSTLSDTKSVLKGNGSQSDAKVISIGKNAQQMSLTTQAVHFGLRSDSNMVTRAVMKDSASAIINGITKIEKGATKANGVQTEKVLMLSPKARGDANPILLIDEDDVTAGHAASVGQVNPEQVYYLMSRGISKQNAERLVIYGFLAPVVSEIPIDAVREQLEKLLVRKLEG
ncbi:Fe-S cluster assembly protein SufD [Paenibacillus sp. BIHB 4019]|uniref:Fe-S cluster assembly protein SufD n=1 Tax=Paenibacillus sp. BIHB 4019 TaxID=1870819 RepID=A0A1B2DBK3_9BACL|nr:MULTISPECIES: Fe-S cluster assembly protein SufD [unclassified Paenibacillus]ANY65089.1 Fe-S cluster assembly protein SufD [Paenibacillus sp. BIHB 4019]KQO01254.1 Fe-S cluster assembly protein SufD [Paenibacillus sp. Leaf72]